MAVLKNGKYISGKAGSSIFGRWRDIETIKGLHQPRKTKREPTEKQAIQRRKWTLMSHFLGEAWVTITQGFSGVDTKRKTPRNLALSYNLKHAMKDGPDGPYIDFSKVVLSKGKLPAPSDVRLKCLGGNFAVSWSPAITSSMLTPQDEAWVSLYNADKKRMLNYMGDVCRADGILEVQLPKDQMEDTFHAYIFFSTEEGYNSPSLYLGEFKAKA